MRLPHLLTFLSGILIVLSFPPWNFWPLIWVALVPWLWVISHAKSSRQACIQGTWLSYFVSMGGFYWVAAAIRQFGGVPWIICILGLQVFGLVGQLQFTAFPLFFRYLTENKTKNKKTLSPFFFIITLILASTYAGIDWILPKVFLDTLGHCFYQAVNLRQLADIGSAHLLTFLILVINISAFNLLLHLFYGRLHQKQKILNIKKPFIHFGMAVVLCILATIYGIYKNNQVASQIGKSPEGVQVAAIQGNIGDFDKLAAENGLHAAAQKILDTFITMTNEALQLTPKPDFVIWPETSYPSTFRNPHSAEEIRINDRLETYARSIHVPLLFGGYDEQEGKDFNAFFYITPQGDLQVYRKNILLIFGEYIPGAEFIPIIKKTFPQVGNFGLGRGPEVLKVRLNNSDFTSRKITEINTSPVICYEGLFPNYNILSANDGSQLIINITNDSWFGNWGEPQLHLALTIFRSIETRLPMLRSTNTGITTLVTPTGEITQATHVGEKAIMNVFVPVYPLMNTLMKMWGDWFGPAALFIGFIGHFFFFWKRRRRTT